MTGITDTCWPALHVTKISGTGNIVQEGLNTLNSTYNEKKYAEILLRYRWLFIKGNVFIGEWVHLVWLFSFIIANFSLKATSL